MSDELDALWESYGKAVLALDGVRKNDSAALTRASTEIATLAARIRVAEGRAPA